MENKFINLRKILFKMIDGKPKNRPTCANILFQKDWSITNIDIKFYGLDNVDYMKNSPDCFLKNLYNQKILYSSDFLSNLFQILPGNIKLTSNSHK